MPFLSLLFHVTKFAKSRACESVICIFSQSNTLLLFFSCPGKSRPRNDAKCMPIFTKGKPIKNKNKLCHHLGNFSHNMLTSNNQTQCVIVSTYRQDSDPLALNSSSYESLNFSFHC